MKAYLLFIIITVLAVSAIGKLMWLSRGHLPLRRARDEAMDIGMNVVVIVWSVILLHQVP